MADFSKAHALLFALAMDAVSATATRQTLPDETSGVSALGESDADLLQGLSVLADLLTNASETLNQCLLTLENKLNAAAIAREEWVPIHSARSGIDRLLSEEERPQSQERVFAGVAVTILKMADAAPLPPAMKRSEWRYELGYAVAGDEWALMIRTVSSDASKPSDDAPDFTDVMPLREAPLEIRLKGIREIPALMQVFAETEPVTPETSNEPAVTDEQPFGADEHRLTVDEVLEQLELELILSPETEFDQEPAADTESYAAAEQEEPVTELKQSPQTRSRS